MTEAFAFLSMIFAPLIFLFSVGLARSLKDEEKELNHEKKYEYNHEPQEIKMPVQFKAEVKHEEESSIEDDIEDLDSMIKKYKEMAH